LIGQCRFDGNLFCFFLPTHKKEEGNPTHIAAHLQAPRANAQNQSLQKSCYFAYAQLLKCTIQFYKCPIQRENTQHITNNNLYLLREKQVVK